MKRKNVKSSIIIGGGIAGLTIADKLSEQNIEVQIIEKSSEIGGICRPVHIGNSRVYPGPHNSRAKNNEILKYWQELLGTDLEVKSFSAIIFFLNSFLAYPIRPFEVISKLPKSALINCGIDLLSEKLKSKLFRRVVKNCEDWTISNYGRGLYEAFFRPNTEKVWGIPARLSDADLSRERLPLPFFPTSLFENEAKRWLSPGRYRACPKT